MLSHFLFDLLALAASIGIGIGFYLWAGRPASPIPTELKPHYQIALLLGLIVGSVLFGSLNLYLSAQPTLGKSVLGGIIGAIVAAELFKWRMGVRGSTGALYVPSLAIGIVIGRIGCFTAGLADHTYGIETSLAWGVDWGDGVNRHPVQLYESGAMALFLLFYLDCFRRQPESVMAQGFYWFAFFYAGQRFVWEFLKPYAAQLGPLNLFHLLCLGLIGYALWMLRRVRYA